MCSPIWFPGQSSCGSSLKRTEKKVPIHAHVLSQKKNIKKCFSLILERKMPMGNLLTSFVQLEKQWELPSLNQTSDLSQEASCLARLQPTTQSSS